MSKILIIDDDAGSRLILSAQLMAKGYKTVFASDAIGGMAMAKREVPDLVAFVAKPANPKELLTIIETHLQKKDEADAKGQRRSKILIVEDDQISRQVLNLQLQANGYHTAFAMDAVSATATVKRDPPDLIILDLGLPGGDGFTVLARLKAVPHLARIPVIVVSGRSAEANATSARERGAVAYLEKPVSHEQLLATVRHHLSSGAFQNNL